MPTWAIRSKMDNIITERINNKEKKQLVRSLLSI